MSTVSLTGNDLVNINGRILSDFADGDIATLTYPNNIADAKTGKNGNSIYAYNSSGAQAELVIRLIRGSNDDKFMLGILTAQNNNFQGTILMIGELVKNVGDGKGNLTADTYALSGGVIMKNVEAKSNVDGDVAQSVSEYHAKFTKAIRVIT